MSTQTGTPHEIAPGVYWLALGSGPMRVNVYFVRSGPAWTLVDTGMAGHGDAIREAAAALFGAHLGPSSIIITHAHRDHTGSARELALSWGCPVLVHPHELPLARGIAAAVRHYATPIDRWTVLPRMRLPGSRRRAARMARSGLGELVGSFDPNESPPGLPAWKVVPTPGHTPGHVALFRASDRILLTGDALVTVDVDSLRGILSGRREFSGPPRVATWSRRIAADSLRRLALLDPHTVAGGHGSPVSGPETAAELRSFAERFAGSAP